MNDIKKCFALAKYSLRYKSMVVCMILFGVAGLLFMVLPTGSSLLGELYLAMVPMYMYQLMTLMNISSYVSVSPIKKKLTFDVPYMIIVVSELLILTLIIVIKGLLITKLNVDTGEDVKVAILMSGIAIASIVLYMGMSLKAYIVSLVIMLILWIPLVSFQMLEISDVLVGLISNMPMPMVIATAYTIAIVAMILGRFLGKLFYKKPLDKKVYRNILAKAES